MSIRQYIGARYVPKFYENPNNTAEWLPNVIYEPLTIVTYDSNSYTSKKTVPASVGIPSNNPEYWVATGNYNAFIQELENEFNDLSDEFEELKSDLSDGLSICFVKNNDNETLYNGNCQIIKTAHVVTVVDLSYEINGANIVSSLNDMNITHIDNVIISHYHADHASAANLQRLITAGFIDSSTNFYLARKANDAPSWNTGLEDIYAAFINVLETNNITYSFPTNGDTISADGLTLTLINCSEADYTYYNGVTNDYNNYSMVVNGTYRRIKFTLNSDIHREAMKRIYDNGYCTQCLLSTLSHHGSSSFDPSYFNAVNSKYYIACASKTFYYARFDSYNKVIASQMGAELYTTSNQDVYFNTNGIYYTLYTNDISDSFNGYIKHDVYLNTNASSDGNGGINTPFNNIGSLISFISKQHNARINVIGNNSTITGDIIINELSDCLIEFNNMTFTGNVRIIRSYVGFYSCTFTNTTNSLRADQSYIYIDTNTTFTGVSSNPAIQLNTSFLRGFGNFTDKTICFKLVECSHVDLEGLTINNCSYIVQNDDINSSLKYAAITGSPTTAICTANTIGNYGQYKDYTDVSFFDSSIGTIERSKARLLKDKVDLQLTITSMTLSSQVTTIGSISDTKLRPKTRIILPVTLLNGGFTSGTLYNGCIIIETNGTIELVTNQYADVDRILCSVYYFV